jgi:hypothetical protein
MGEKYPPALFTSASTAPSAACAPATARDGHVTVTQSETDGRSRIVAMTTTGAHVWGTLAQPKIAAFYASALDGFSVNDLTHTLHYLLKLLDNMQRIDGGREDADG